MSEESKNEIAVNEKGRLVTSTHTELLRYCSALIKGGGVNKRFQTAEEVFSALMFVREKGLPDSAINQVALVQGSVTMYGDLPLALVQKSKQLTHFKEVWFDKDYNEITFSNKNLNAEAYGAVCFIARGGDIQEFAFTLDDAKKANLYPANAMSPWSKYTRIMLRYKARTIALKSMFADIISGTSVLEYEYDLSEHDIRDVSPDKIKSSAKQLEGLFDGSETEESGGNTRIGDAD